MKKIFIFILIVFLFSFVSSVGNYNSYYKINLTYSDENISYNNINIIFSNKIIENNFGLWDLSLYDINDNLLEFQPFFVEDNLGIEKINSEGYFSGVEEIKKPISFFVYLPYNENGSYIKIYNNESKMIESFPVLMFSETVKNNSIFNKQQIIGKKIDYNISSPSKESKRKNDIQTRGVLEEIFSDYWLMFLIVLALSIFILIKKLREPIKK